MTYEEYLAQQQQPIDKGCPRAISRLLKRSEIRNGKTILGMFARALKSILKILNNIYK